MQTGWCRENVEERRWGTERLKLNRRKRRRTKTPKGAAKCRLNLAGGFQYTEFACRASEAPNVLSGLPDCVVKHRRS